MFRSQKPDSNENRQNFIKLTIGSKERPIGEITRYIPAENERLENINPGNINLSGLEALFQNAPNLALSAANVWGNSYLLNLTPEVAVGLKNGSLSFMQASEGGIHGIVVDQTRKINDVISLQANSTLQLAGAGLVFWHLLSVVTAQKYLADIFKEINQLKDKVAELKNFLEDVQYAEMTGNLKYLQEMANSLREGNIQENEFSNLLHQIDAIERQLLKQDTLWKSQAATVLQSIESKKIEKSFWLFQNNDNIEQFEKSVQQYQKIAVYQLYQLWVRSLSAELRSLLPASPQIALQRLTTINQEIASWQTQQQHFYQTLTTQIGKIEGLNPLKGDKPVKRLTDSAERGRSVADELCSNLTLSIDRSIVQLNTRLNVDILQSERFVVQLDEKCMIRKISKIIPDN